MARAAGRPIVGDVQDGFGGGLNIAADASQLAANELRRADNVRLTEYGAAAPRGGTQRVHTAALPGAIRGGYSWRQGTTAVQYALVGAQLYKGTYGVPMTWATIGAAIFSATAVPSFAEFTDATGATVLYIADGGALVKCDGTSVTRLATENVAQLAVYNRRLIGAGDPAHPYRQLASAIDNGDTLGVVASGGIQDIVQVTGALGELTALDAEGGALAMWHRDGISRFTGSTIDDIAIGSGATGISGASGTIAPRAIVRYGNDQYAARVYLSDNGIYELTAFDRIRSLSPKIDPIIAKLDQSIVTRALGVHARATRELWFYLPDIGVYVYNYRLGGGGPEASPYIQSPLGAWSGPWTGIYTSAGLRAIWEATDASQNRILLGGFADGYVRRLDVPGKYIDDLLADGTGGTKYVMTAGLHRMFFQDGRGASLASHTKGLKRIFVTAAIRGSSAGTITWRTAEGAGQATPPFSAGDVWGSGKWGAPRKWGAGGAQTRYVDADGRGPSADLAITDGTGNYAVYSRVEVEAFDLGRR